MVTKNPATGAVVIDLSPAADALQSAVENAAPATMEGLDPALQAEVDAAAGRAPAPAAPAPQAAAPAPAAPVATPLPAPVTKLQPAADPQAQPAEQALQAELDRFNAQMADDPQQYNDMMSAQEENFNNTLVDSQSLDPELRSEIDAVATQEGDAQFDDDSFLSKALDVPVQVLGGFRDAADSMRNLVFDMGEGAAKLLYVDTLGLATADELKQVADSQRKATDVLPEVPGAKSAVGAITRPVAQFLAPFGAMAKLKVGQSLGKGALYARGVATDFIAFEEHEKRLSNMINEVGWGNAVTEYLAADPDDSWAEGRFKNALEGLGLAGTVDGLVKGVKYIKQGREVRQVINQAREKAPEAVKAIRTKAAELKTYKDEIKAKLTAPVNKAGVAMPRPNKEEISLATQRRMAAANGTTLEELNKGDVFKNLRKAGIQDTLNKVTLLEEQEFNNLVPRLKDYVARSDAGDTKAAEEFFLNEGGAFLEVAGNARDAFQDAARALGARGNNPAIVTTNKIIERIAQAGGESQDALMRAMVQLADPAQVGNLLENIGKKGPGQITKEVVHEWYVNAILSSPKTQMVDTMGTMIWSPWLAFERLPSAASGMLRQRLGGAAERVYADEAAVMMKSMFSSVMDGFSFIAKSARNGSGAVLDGAKDLAGKVRKGDAKGALVQLSEAQRNPGEVRQALEKLKVDNASRFDTPRHNRAISAENFGLERDSLLGRMLDFSGAVVNAPTTFMQAKDDVAKAMLYRAEVNALAVRQAKNEGLTGAAFEARVQQLKNVPGQRVSLDGQKITENPVSRLASALAKGDDAAMIQNSMEAQASRFAQEGTFTNELGPTMQAVQNAIQTLPGGKIIFPFIKTPTNIMSRFIERTPLAPVLLQRVRDDLIAGGVRADMAMGRMVAGTSAMALGWQMAASGFLTGEGPKNAAEREALTRTGWRPRSVKIGDKYFEYGRLDPMASFFSFAANIVELSDQLENDLGADLERDVGDYASLGILAFSNMMLSKTWTQSAAEMMDAINRQDENAFERMINFYGSSITVPNAVTFFANEVNPILQDAGTLWETIKVKAGVTVRPKLDIFGNTVQRDPSTVGFIIPATHSSVTDDPTMQALVAAGAFIPRPERRIEGVEMTRDEYYDMMQEMKAMDVKGAMDDLVKSDIWQVLPDSKRTGIEGAQSATRSGVATKLYSEYLKVARQITIQKHPELQRRISAFKQNLQRNSATTPLSERTLRAQGAPVEVNFGMQKQN
jgi:hypothetical protein